jgi:outer membrane protein assembly factor BamD (BamD/ComL family)
MSSSHSSSSTQTLIVRIAACLVLSLSLVVCGLQVLVAIAPPPQIEHADASQTAAVAPTPLPALLIPPLMTLATGFGLAGLLEGIARLLSHQPVAPAPGMNVDKLTVIVAQMQAALPALFESLRQSMQTMIAEQQVSPDLQLTSTTEVHLEKMVKLLEEMKDVSMLDETQRQQRRKTIADRRKTTRLDEAGRLIQQQEWAQADALLHLMESLHPGDPEVLARRNELDDARTLVQALEWDKLGGQVEDLMALSNYDKAIAVASHFLDRFPGHPECRALLQRVQREKAVYLDRHATALYDQIKTSVDNRQWRVALDGIQQFLQYFPEHPRSEKIRLQVRPIQKNAEIEERQELEARVRELVTARQYGEAADMIEDLLQRFPSSPQAVHLAEILPKLRERATSEVAGNVFLG